MQVSADILTEDFPDPVIPITLSLCECQSSSRKPSTHGMMKSRRICAGVGVPCLTIEVEVPPGVVVPPRAVVAGLTIEVEVHPGAALELDVRRPLRLFGVPLKVDI
jgi:hypothetical protein